MSMTNFMRFAPRIPSSSSLLVSSSPCKFYSQSANSKSTYYQILIRRDEGDVAYLLLEVHSKRFYAIAHAVCRSHARKVLQEVGQRSLVWRLLKVVVLVVYLLLQLHNQKLFVVFAVDAALR